MTDDSLRELFEQLSSGRIPGGCDHCDAYQSMTQADDLVWFLTVHHDDDCPWWIAHQQRTGRQ